MLLIPTKFERSVVSQRVERLCWDHDRVVAVTCGFGPVVPGAVVTESILQYQPTLVILCGIAGLYARHEDRSFGDEVLQVGRAYEFSKVFIDGIGVGQGAQLQTPSQLGWQQLEEDQGRPAIGDSVELSQNNDFGLLTVCAASANLAQAGARVERFPDVVAEDMEGFSVAVACERLKKNLRIVRGISNIAGNRDHSTWEINQAMETAMAKVEAIVDAVDR